MKTNIEPEEGEVWLTKSGNKVLIIRVYSLRKEPELGFVWYDSTDNTLQVTCLSNQLAERIDMTRKQWLMEIYHESW